VKLISDENGLYGATSTASIYFSSDNGLNWESLPLHPDIFPYGVDLFDKVDDYLFFSQNIGGSTYNYRTYYNGENWEDWEILPYDESIIYEFVHNDNTIYALLNQGISVSSDYGTSWELIDTPSITGYIHLQYVDDQYLYINHGCILYRYNIETFEWVDITGILDDIGPPEPYSCTSIHQIEKFNDKLLISMYWYGGVGTLFYSQNNGDSWNIINSFPSFSNSGYGTNNVSAVTTKNGILYAGTATSEDGIYYTQNLIDWTEYSAGLSNYNLSVSALAVTEENIYKLGGSVNLFQNELIGVCDDGYTEYDGECYYDEDLNFLTLLIYMNEIEFELHYDIGLTIWQNGRINTLLLEGMAIHEIPNNIQNLDSLVHLSFSDNELEFLPDAIGNLPSLNALFLSNNILVEIPETIGNLVNLEFFHMPGNQLTELPLSISNISSLMSLNIDNNYFTTFPSVVLELNNLKYVYIANNTINSLPTNINMISSLQILSAYSNNISILPSSVGELSNLYHFDFSNNDLTSIPDNICNIYDNLTVFDIGLNDICPPYPDCLSEDAIGYQDTAECVSLGDINGDGTINVIDIVLLASFVLQTDFPTDTEFMAADFNADGTLNILDVVSIVDLILNPQVLIQINSGTSYGECWGYCVFELQLDNSNALFTASGWGWYEFPDLLLEDNLSQEMWQQIIELLDFEYFQSLDDVYGCPDCADGGAEFIEIIYDGVAKQVTFDAYTEIDGIQELTILLRDLRAEYWNQINENQECSIMPEVGPCDGICPTYYFNQNTNQCEEFITGCCGIEAFDTMQGCIDACE